MTHDLFAQLASMRETLASPIPEPDLPHALFLRCDGCGEAMRSETAFLCRGCIRTHGSTSPEGQRLIAKGMEQVGALRETVDEAMASGRWN